MKPLNGRQIIAMASSGENTNVDFKETLFTNLRQKSRVTQHHELVKDLSAFANTDGGYLLVGVDDDGKIVGFRSNDKLEQRIVNLCRDISSPPLSPYLQRVRVGEKEVLVIRIEKGAHDLCLVRGKIYIRVHNEVRLASSSEITSLVLQRNHHKMRELIMEKESLSVLISRVSKLSTELFKAKSLVQELNYHDFCKGTVDLNDILGHNLTKLLNRVESMLTNLEAVEISKLPSYIKKAEEYIDSLETINIHIEELLDDYYCKLDLD